MNRQELRIVSALAAVFSLRMLGLCMLLPVFALEAIKYPQANAQLIGLAIGVYGLAQALLQIPFGILSDKYGRKPLMLCGLAFLLSGSLISACATSIYGLIVGRILQGSGAIGSVVIATLIDNTSEQVRARSMAVLGISIGLAFILAMVMGPLLTQRFGFVSVFWVTAILAVGGIVLLLCAIPKTAARTLRADVASSRHNWRAWRGNAKLLSLNFGIFVLHASLAALFLVLPVLLQQAGFVLDKLWHLYLGSLLVAIFMSLRLITLAEQRQVVAGLQILAIAVLLLAEIMLAVSSGRLLLMLSLTLFFAAFCVLEASLPTLVAKFAPAESRGAALGVYSCLQFLGVFFGGSIGGWVHAKFGMVAVLVFCVLLSVVWLGFSAWPNRNKEVKLWLGV